MYTFLLAYHSTPHSVTGCSPAELLFSRQLRTKLPEVSSIISSAVGDAAMRQRNLVQKEKGRQAADKRRAAVDSMIQAGDCVLLKQPKQNKLTTAFEPEPYRVVERKGPSVILEKNGVKCMRHVSSAKRWVSPQIQSADMDDAWMGPDHVSKEPSGRVPVREQSVHRPRRIRREPLSLKDYVR